MLTWFNTFFVNCVTLLRPLVHVEIIRFVRLTPESPTNSAKATCASQICRNRALDSNLSWEKQHGTSFSCNLQRTLPESSCSTQPFMTSRRVFVPLKSVVSNKLGTASHFKYRFSTNASGSK
uniref:(northern house mosquito) hypothetical protein n=1 Tax=Culex pipiens TaxID=7175 RepID=A0A8D8C7C1_CULPI